MMPRSSTPLILQFAFLALGWALSPTIANQASNTSDVGEAIPKKLLQQLEDAIAERNTDLQQRIALVQELDQHLEAANLVADSPLVKIQYEVRFLDALNSMRLNQFERCAEQLTRLRAMLDSNRFQELDFRCRSLDAAVMLLRGHKQESLAAFEQLLSGDLSNVPAFQLDRARINQAVAFERNGMLEEAIDRYQSIMLLAIEEKRDLAALQAGNNLLNLLLDLEDTTVARQALEALQPVVARNPTAIGTQSLHLFELRLLIWEGSTDAGIKGLRAMIDQPIPPPAFLLGSAHKRLAEALQQQGKLDESIVHAKQAVELLAKLEADVKHARLLLSQLHLQNGDYQSASELLKLIGDPLDLSTISRAKYYQVKLESQLRLAGLHDEANELNDANRLLQLQAKSPLKRLSKSFELELTNLTKSLESQRAAALELARLESTRAERYGRYSMYGVFGVVAVFGGSALLINLRRRGERLKLRRQESLNAQLESLVTAKTMELKVNLEQQAKMAQALEKKNRIETIGLLAGNIAHDINNLLQVIGNANVTLADTTTNQQLRDQALAISNESLRHGTGVIRQILDYVRPQESSIQLVRIEEYLRNSRAMFQAALGNSSRLNVEDDSRGACVYVDQSHLTTSMLNLLSNADDAMPTGGDVHIRASRLTVTVQDATHWQNITPGAYVQICVQDSGSGMLPEQLTRAFEPFFSTKGFGAGTGLGLSSVHGFVKQSGGDVKLESSTAGTLVLMLLPQAQSTELAPPIPEPLPPAVPTDPLANKRLLLVEDNEAVARSMMLLLARLQLQTMWSSSGDDAANLLRKDSAYDFVLSDLHTPGAMDGVSLAEWVADNYPEISVILMSGYHDVPVDRIQVPLLQKPFRLDELKELLCKVAKS